MLRQFETCGIFKSRGTLTQRLLQGVCPMQPTKQFSHCFAIRGGKQHPYSYDGRHFGLLNIHKDLQMADGRSARSLMRFLGQGDPIPFLALPSAITSLILKGLWREVMLVGSWQNSSLKSTVPLLWADWPSCEWIACVTGNSGYQHISCSAATAQQALQCLESLRFRLSADDEHESLDYAKSVLRSATALVCQPRAAWGRMGDHRFGALNMLWTLVAAANVRSTAELRDTTFPAMVKAVFDPSFANVVLEKWKNSSSKRKKTIASKSTQSRYAFFIDSAFMQVEKHESLTQSTKKHYWMFDSSPQADENWLLTLRSSITAADAAEVAKCVRMLMKCKPSKPNSLLSVQQREGCEEKINTSFEELQCPPVALGPRRSATEHKVSAFVHSASLSIHAEKLELFLADDSVTGTSDHGTESAAPNFMGESGASCLPDHMQGDAFDCDTAVPQADANVGGDFVFRCMLGVVGACHVLNKSCKDLCDAMPWWPFFKNKLDVLCGVFSTHLIETFCKCCVEINTKYSRLTNVFTRATFKRPIDWRWFSCIPFCEALHKWRHVIRGSWNEHAMASGNDPDDKRSGDAKGFDFKAVSTVIEDDFV